MRGAAVWQTLDKGDRRAACRIRPPGISDFEKFVTAALHLAASDPPADLSSALDDGSDKAGPSYFDS
eukprot:125315-Alexandrium_andersonii.AAC.1